MVFPCLSGFGNPLGNVGQCFINLINQDQTQIARNEPLQCRVNGDKFAVDFLDVFRALGVFQTQLKKGEHFSIGTSTLALILIQHDLIEGIAENFRLLPDILIASVTGTADDD